MAGPASTVISTAVAASMLSVSAAHAASLYVVDDTSATTRRHLQQAIHSGVKTA
jgi:hypothetical protein